MHGLTIQYPSDSTGVHVLAKTARPLPWLLKLLESFPNLQEWWCWRPRAGYTFHDSPERVRQNFLRGESLRVRNLMERTGQRESQNPALVLCYVHRFLQVILGCNQNNLRTCHVLSFQEVLDDKPGFLERRLIRCWIQDKKEISLGTEIDLFNGILRKED